MFTLFILRKLFKYKNVVQEVYFIPFESTKDINGKKQIYTAKDKAVLSIIKQSGIELNLVLNTTEKPDISLVRSYKQMGVTWITLFDLSYAPYLNDIFKIKNSVRNNPSFNDIKTGKYDFLDMIYVHDGIILHPQQWRTIHKNRLFGTVVNFVTCVEHCQYVKQHYSYIEKTGNKNFPICPYNRRNAFFKKHNLAIKQSFTAYNNLSDVIDLYKLQGRQNIYEFLDDLKIIEGIHNHEKLFKTMYNFKLLNALRILH